MTLRSTFSRPVFLAVLLASGTTNSGCSTPPSDAAGTKSSGIEGVEDRGDVGDTCVFDCTAWNGSEFGGARSPALLRHLVSTEGAMVATIGKRNASRVCVPNAVPAELRAAVTAVPTVSPERPGPDEEGVDAKEEVMGSEFAEGAFRYACLADGLVLRQSDVRDGVAPTVETDDLQTFFEKDCLASGLCPRAPGADAETDGTPPADVPPAGDEGKVPGDGDGANVAILLVERAKGARTASLRLANWNPNENVPVGWWGRRIVARIEEGPCKAFDAMDRYIGRIDNRWGVYASYGAGGGAGGALKFGAAFAYDLTNSESAAYIDGGVNIGFNASIGVNVARGITLGVGNGAYDGIHNFFGGNYAGVNGSVGTPFVNVGVGAQLSVNVPAGHPVALELSANFGVGVTPFEANATVGRISPTNVGTRMLRGVTGGLVNVFDDEYGTAPFDGVALAAAGRYERMRNSPGSSELWRAGSMANSAVRFAGAHDLAAVFVLRAAFQRAWAGMRRVCAAGR
ncbi:MAG: hypothetical protein U0169_06615 [Polyangiaceae bacterium]